MTYYHGKLLTEHPPNEDEEEDESVFRDDNDKVAAAKERLRLLETDYRTKDRSARIR